MLFRELAQQIQEVADQFGASSRLKNICVFGGAPKGPQLENGEFDVGTKIFCDAYDLMTFKPRSFALGCLKNQN